MYFRLLEGLRSDRSGIRRHHRRIVGSRGLRHRFLENQERRRPSVVGGTIASQAVFWRIIQIQLAFLGGSADPGAHDGPYRRDLQAVHASRFDRDLPLRCGAILRPPRILGINTKKRPARLMKVVSAAPCCRTLSSHLNDQLLAFLQQF